MGRKTAGTAGWRTASRPGRDGENRTPMRGLEGRQGSGLPAAARRRGRKHDRAARVSVWRRPPAARHKDPRREAGDDL